VSLVPEVSVVVELRVAVDERADPVLLEQRVAAEGRRAARQLYRMALRVLDEILTQAAVGARQRTEERWLATSFGRIRIWRYRVRDGDGSFHPLDRALQLSQAEASPALRETICDLATRVPYRQAAEIAERLTGEPLSHQGAWRILQQEGARVRTEEGELVASGPAAVVRSLMDRSFRMITPAARNPIPLTICAAIRVGSGRRTPTLRR
jgi:hypothetical protein